RIGELTATIAICFDVHFLADEAADALSTSDVLLFPSAWVDERAGEDARGPIFAELTRRFGVAIVNANWAPSIPRLPGQGGSRIVGRDGRPLAVSHGGAAIASIEPRRRG